MSESERKSQFCLPFCAAVKRMYKCSQSLYLLWFMNELNQTIQSTPQNRRDRFARPCAHTGAPTSIQRDFSSSHQTKHLEDWIKTSPYICLKSLNHAGTYFFKTPQ